MTTRLAPSKLTLERLVAQKYEAGDFQQVSSD